MGAGGETEGGVWAQLCRLISYLAGEGRGSYRPRPPPGPSHVGRRLPTERMVRFQETVSWASNSSLEKLGPSGFQVLEGRVGKAAGPSPPSLPLISLRSPKGIVCLLLTFAPLG